MMDFSLGERQQAVADLAAEVLGADNLGAADPWKELARAGLLDVSPPDGLGVLTHDGAHHVNATYYSGVRVPARMRVGAENDGWRLITTQLNHERVMLGPAGRIAALHDRVRAWAAERSLLTQPDVRRALARARAVMRVNELLNWQVASSGGLGGVVPPGANRASAAPDVADASVTKVFSSEQLQLIGPDLAEVVGRHADADPATAELMTWLDVQLKRNIVLTFGGGVNEIQRELIATAGLRLPRAPR